MLTCSQNKTSFQLVLVFLYTFENDTVFKILTDGERQFLLDNNSFTLIVKEPCKKEPCFHLVKSVVYSKRQKTQIYLSCIVSYNKLIFSYS